MSRKTHSEKTSADNKSIGFDFQYYYFLYRLLKLQSDETVGLEVLDDVHTQLSDSRQILVQLKHTTQTNSDGSAKNLTTLDIDLWKTLSNWSQVIADKKAGREQGEDQLRFVKRTDFLLFSNKSHSKDNNALECLAQFKDGSLSYGDLVKYLKSLKEETSNNDLKKYIENLLVLKEEVAEAFYNNLRFDLGNEAIILQCKNAIKEKMISDNRIDDVFASLDSQLRLDNFIAIGKKDKIIICFEDFHQKYRRHFDLARNENLNVRNFSSSLPDNLESQKFIQQLIDVGDIDVNDKERQANYTRCKLKTQNNLDKWYQDGDIVENEINEFDQEAKNRWDNEFHSIYRNCGEENLQKNALKLLDTVRKQTLPIASQELPIDVSNGQYYRLSDVPEIGWDKDWEKKYK